MRSINHLSDEAMLLETKLKPEKKSADRRSTFVKESLRKPKVVERNFSRRLKVIKTERLEKVFFSSTMFIFILQQTWMLTSTSRASHFFRFIYTVLL